MKKILVITLNSGRVITRDLTFNIPSFDQGGPEFGAPANHEYYAMLCQSISVNGYTDPDAVTDSLYTHIAPGMIATVQMKFEKAN